MKKIIKLTEADLNKIIKAYYGNTVDLQDKVDGLYAELSDFLLQGKELINKLSNDLDRVSFEVKKTKLSKEQKEELNGSLDNFENVLFNLEQSLDNSSKDIFGLDI